jgi:hypothetical protein
MLSLTANARDTGYVGLKLHAVAGEPVSIRDEATGETRTLTPTSDDTALRRFATWRCEARARRFTATQGTATTSAEVRTPPCARRLELVAPRVQPADAGASVRIRDRWRLGGVSARFCVRPPGMAKRCRQVRIRPGRRLRSGRQRGESPGNARHEYSNPSRPVGG